MWGHNHSQFKKNNVWEILNKRFKKVDLDVFIDNTGNTEVMARGYDILTGLEN